jgi:hypothetical protein
MPRRFRGDVARNCEWRYRRVGWPCLTRGRNQNKIPYAQVQARREVLATPDQAPFSCGAISPRAGMAGPPVHAETIAYTRVTRI